MDREGIGLRACRYRILAGLTQQQVADSMGVTKSYVSHLETGRRPVSTRSTLAGLAKAVGVSVTDLIGQPYTPVTRSDLETYKVVPQVRAALEEPDEPSQPRDIRLLETAADLAMAARMNCDMAALGEHLPGLLADTRTLWFGRGDRAAGVLLVKAAVTGSLALKSAGWVDLGLRLAELADTVASTLGDPACIAAARFAVAQCALSTGGRRRSARIAVAGINDLDQLTRTRMPANTLNDVLAWLGVLHLHAALSVAALDGGDPDGHLTEAAGAARRVTGDPWRMEFSTANVGTWAVGIALESGHPERGPQLARLVNPHDLRTPQRRSRLHSDTARSLFLAGDTEAAIRAFLSADQAAPGDLRSHGSVVEIVSQMVRDAPQRGTGSEPLRDLAVRVGVDPFAPEPES